MDATIRELRKEELLTVHGGRFDEENAERVTNWLVAAEDRRPVLLIGAGYSLNARDRETGLQATRAQAPLWSDVVEQLASDVGLPPTQYDAPTLFELYGEMLGEAKLRDALRGCFADDALGPGPAHESIAGYPSEAIVTTNCLDTLLDRVCAVGWRRVVEDSDLSTQGQLRDLIYLHGHRDYADSWVMTRSQYEDFHRTRPVIVARTRQLLAQHPWIVVGFGMSDPNFHSITRLLGTEMRRRQPLSLVVMPRSPLTAERLHWRRLGFEIVAPERADNLGEFFSWVLSKLTTNYSPTSEAANAYVGRASTPADRLRRFRSVNPHPIVDKEATYRAWESDLAYLLSEEERATAFLKAQAAAQAAFAHTTRLGSDAGGSEVTRVLPSPPLQSSILSTLESDPDLRPLASDRHVQVLDAVLVGKIVGRASLAEHFAWALQNELFEHSHPRPLMEVVTVFLASEADCSKGSIEKLIHAAFGLVRRYEHASVEETLERALSPLGLAAPVADPLPEAPHLLEASSGYRALLNADFDQAAKNYGAAAKAAAAARLDLETWAYTVGQADALERMSKAQPEVRDLAKALRDQALRLRQSPVVKHWIERADQRLKMALREGLDGERTRERYRMTGGQGHRWSNSINSAWRSYRELQALCAPTSLQRYYLAPVTSYLDAGDLRGVLANLEKPREWIESLLRSPSSSLSARQQRDGLLIEGILGPYDERLTRTEHLVALECVPQLISVLRKEDVPKALEWLTGILERYPQPWQSTAWSSRSIGENYWTAFSCCAHWAKPAEALAVARKLLGNGANERASAARALYSLPWTAWPSSADEDSAKGFAKTVTELLPEDDQDAWRSGTAYVFFCLLRMATSGLPDESVRVGLDRWTQAFATVKAKPLPQTRYSEVRRAGYMLERELQRRGFLEQQAAEQLFGAWFSSADAVTRDDREELWSALTDAIEPDLPVNSALVQQLVIEVARFLADIGPRKRYALNPHLALAPVRLLVLGLRLLPEKRAEIEPALLELVMAAPEHIAELRPALSKELWSDARWGVLRGLFAALCGGGPPQFFGRLRDDPGFSTRCQRAMLVLLGSSNEQAVGAHEAELWRPVKAFALSAVNDERLGVAYAAAFSIAQTASTVANDEAELYCTAILRIADDPRAEVRSAVARDGISLMSRANSAAVRGAAEKAIDTVRTDDNAQISVLLERAEFRETALSRSPTMGGPRNTKS